MELEKPKSKMQFKGDSKLQLQKRDIEILRCCYEQQFMLYEQIARFYFRDAVPRLARRRIYRLKQAGLLCREQQQRLAMQQILRVTETGKRIARSVSPFDVPQSRKVDLATLTHDRIVTDVRLRLHELWDGVWVPERALKDRYERIPDGLFQFDGTGRTIAVEIENSTKGQARFKSIMNEWARTEGVQLVLYIATSIRVYDAIHKLFATAPDRPAFALVSYDAFMRSIATCHSPRGALDLFARRTL